MSAFQVRSTAENDDDGDGDGNGNGNGNGPESGGCCVEMMASLRRRRHGTSIRSLALDAARPI